MTTVEISRERHTWCCHRCHFRWSAEVEVRRVAGLEYCWERGLPAPPPLASRRCPRCDGLRVDERLEPEPARAAVRPPVTKATRPAHAVPWWLGLLRVFVTHPVDEA